ncbi:MAG: class I SAM-dependent RNA methyltransferase, partial [Pseudomonadota bacterium]
EACRVLDPRLTAALAPLAAAAGLAASRKGELRLAALATEDGLDVDLSGASPRLDGGALAGLAQVAAEAGWARLTLNAEPLAAARPPRLRFGRARVTLPPAGFAQATQAGEAALVAAVRGATRGARRVADLFCGAGTFALPLAETAEVHAVEGDAAHLEALAAGWRGASGGLRRVTTEARDLFRRPLRPDELSGFDAVVF